MIVFYTVYLLNARENKNRILLSKKNDCILRYNCYRRCITQLNTYAQVRHIPIKYCSVDLVTN